MTVFGKEKLESFCIRHVIATKAVDKWLQVMQEHIFKDMNDLKSFYPSVDYVGNERFVFNIKGTTYRIITVIAFIGNAVIIRWIGTHAEYNKIKDCSKI